MATHKNPLDLLFEELLAEPKPAMEERARETFDKIAGNRRSIVLFGAGALGEIALQGMKKCGIAPVAFTDNNPKRWGQTLEGVEILSPEEAAAKYKETACFVVTIFNGSQVVTQAARMGCTASSYIPLFWKYSQALVPDYGIELPHRILEHIDEITRCYAILADDASREELCQQIRWRCLLDGTGLPKPLPAQEMHFGDGIFSPLEREVFVDCGAFDGDSLKAFLQRRDRRFRQIYVVEPDPHNRANLMVYVESLPQDIRSRITLLPFALDAKATTISFHAAGTVTSKIDVSGNAGRGECISVECRALDNLISDPLPTYIKMDIEGAEPSAIRGCTRILQTSDPVISACTYHRSEHLWEIPNLVHSIRPDYKIFLRRYAEDCWESVCYGIPPARQIH